MTIDQIHPHHHTHAWLKQINLAYVPGPSDPVLDKLAARLLESFQAMEHNVLPQPQDQVDVLLTSAPFGKPLNWRKAMLFTARRRFHLEKAPLVFTLIHARPDELEQALERLEHSLEKEPPNPEDFRYPGMAESAFHTLYEQGRRGGPILALVRVLQAQSKCVRIILVIGEDEPQYAYTFDLVGAHPVSRADQGPGFYDDLALRILTAASTHEITEHQVVGKPIANEEWQELSTPGAMRRAGFELGERHFFTEMVRVDNLVQVPAVQEAVASQYSEGCFATWDVALNALVTTITGSARPVEKDRLSDDELAVIVAVRPDGRGAQVRHVEGKRNDPPSSEAVEMIQMDIDLPRIRLGPDWGPTREVPVARSKLHGHRGVRAFDPAIVEHAPLDPPFYHYPVSCSTEAQANAIQSAFSRAQALRAPDDPRQIVFTVLPGHGIVIVEKWAAGKQPFQLIWDAMDSGKLQIDNHVPQGPLTYQEGEGGLLWLMEEAGI